MPILTFTTDWGLRDHYVASFKGELLSSIPSLMMIDITHEIEKFNIMQGAYVVQNSFRKFPKGTIHFIGISGNENARSQNPFVLIRINDQYLIGEDSGIFTLILGNAEKEIIRLPLHISAEREKICKALLEVIRQLASGADLTLIGNSDSAIKESYFAQPTVDNQTIRGTVIYIDSFGNVTVNVKRELFEQEKKGRKFIIYLRKSEYNVTEISSAYEEVIPGEMLALFNQDGFLEIALNKNSASQLLGLKLMDPIRIEFDGDKVG